MANNVTQMHKLYGVASGSCGECSHLLARTLRGGKTVRKCAVYGDSDSASTDWAVYYKACGFKDKEMEYSQVPVAEWLRKQPKKKAAPSVPGQVTLFSIIESETMS